MHVRTDGCLLSWHPWSLGLTLDGLTHVAIVDTTSAMATVKAQLNDLMRGSTATAFALASRANRERSAGGGHDQAAFDKLSTTPHSLHNAATIRVHRGAARTMPRVRWPRVSAGRFSSAIDGLTLAWAGVRWRQQHRMQRVLPTMYRRSQRR